METSHTPSDDEMALESEDDDAVREEILHYDTFWGVYEYYKDDKGALVGFRTEEVDRVWNGWDAALIVSKLEKAHHAVSQDNYGKSVAEKEDVAKVIKPDECEIHLGKRKARETLEILGRDLTFRKDFRLSQPYQKKEEDNHLIELDKPKKEHSFDTELEVLAVSKIRGKYKMQPQMILKAVAALTLQGVFTAMCGSEELLSTAGVYEIVRKIVFNLFVKFVLSVFDMEDFESLNNSEVMVDEYSTFFSNLRAFDCDPLTAVAEGRVEFDKFSTLREHDFCDIIRQHEVGENDEAWPWDFSLSPVGIINISESDITLTMMEMQKYVPLKEACKMQLTLELTRGKSYHILDTLVLEALKDIEVEELFKYFAEVARYEQSRSLEEMVKDQTKEANSLLLHFVAGITTGLYDLASQKKNELRYFQEAVTSPLSCGMSGPCEDEVAEVIEIADHERRIQDERFITLEHILFGLSLSRVGDCVQRILSEMELKCWGGQPTEFSMLKIYKLSRDAATILGKNKVGLEHLVLAIVFGKPEGVFDDQAWDAELLERLKNSNKKCGVERWKDSDVYSEFLSHRRHVAGSPSNRCPFVRKYVVSGWLVFRHEGSISLLKQLHKALESGRLKELSAIRQKENA